MLHQVRNRIVYCLDVCPLEFGNNSEMLLTPLTLNVSSDQPSNLLLAHASTVLPAIGPRPDPLIYFCFFPDFYVF
jgi:hypothetical protein